MDSERFTACWRESRRSLRCGLLVGVVVLGSWVGAVGLLAPRVAAQAATPTAATTDCPATTPEENKALVRRYVEEVWNAHNPAAVRELLAEDFMHHHQARSAQHAPGLADEVAQVERSLREFPDAHGTIEVLIAEGDRVAVLLQESGTEEGASAYLGAPATHRRAEWESVIIWRVVCGKLAENWWVTDRLTEYRQLGIITDAELATVGTPTVATPVATPLP